MNKFTFVNEANAEVIRELDGWIGKIGEYLRDFFDGEIEQARGTQFGDCISKVYYLFEIATVEPNKFRGVKDKLGKLQAGAIVESYFDYLEIDTLTNAPWNVLKNQPETLKGSGTSLMEILVNESIDNGFSGRIKLYPLQRAKEFYTDIGFVEKAEGDWELTEEAALSFLEEQKQFWDTGRRSS